MRLKLTIAYDGRPFAGWQSQRGRPTVQDAVESAIAAIAGLPGEGAVTRLHAAGRTDTGVHALGQVAHFDTPRASRLGEAEWHRALNALLPPTVRIMRCQQVRPDFHARFDATGKTYRYRMWHGEVLPPIEYGLAWHLHGCLDVARLRRSARLFIGRHDFSAFCANRGEDAEETRDKVRTVRRVDCTEAGELVTLEFEGDGFLYKMVRMIVGAVVRVARGHEPPERLAELLAHPTQKKPGWQAPADGLTLVEVGYDPPSPDENGIHSAPEG
ncbi:MAG: tRNA pseudouridine(38-40) synthase TruA [Verrucomicrobiales bacterium]